MIRVGAGVTHRSTGRLGRVLRGRPCRGFVRVLFDGSDSAIVVYERDIKLLANRYAAAKAWINLTGKVKT